MSSIPFIEFIKDSDLWLSNTGPKHHSIISCRARYARNLEHIPYAPRASDAQLQQVLEAVDDAIGAIPFFAQYRRLEIRKINSLYRRHLRESHLISTELEQGGEHRVIYVSPDYRISMMVNEEDHLRMQCLDVGFQVRRVLSIMDEVDSLLREKIPFAHDRQFGYLTACPTNVGTGLRLSVMMHLPALALIKRIDEITQGLSQYGLTVRGAYGEGSDHIGDFYQISNEVTLGKNVQETCATIEEAASQIVERELAARNALFEQQPLITHDLIRRAFAILKNAAIIDTAEALTHLSKMRLGIDHGLFHPLTHSELSRLMVEIQPGHLQFLKGSQMSEEARDKARAQFLQQRLSRYSCN